MSININAIETYTNILECMTAEEILLATTDNEHICAIKLHDVWLATD